jgi:glutamate/tyrosine decarboxylase-like PLP-dependent enzyme
VHRTNWSPIFERASRTAARFLEQLPDRPVAPRRDFAAMLAAFDRPVPEGPTDPEQVIEELAGGVEPGLCAMPGGRFFGWVTGGTLPSAVAADWLTSAWDQCAHSAEPTPAAIAIERVALRWVGELLGVPARSAVLVTGAQMANFVSLAVARTEVLRAAGWDLAADGLVGAPRIEVVVGAERHASIDRALRMLGIGARQLRVIEADTAGRMRADRLDPVGTLTGTPLIVCAQAGNVNGGAFDPLPAIAEWVAAARQHRPVWLHLDGAFGLWARAAPARRALADGAELADSWATDGHKWLNTPYDCGIALLRDGDAHRRAFYGGAAYLPDDAAADHPFHHTPELSRRARGFALWAALRELGRSGVADLVERCCRHASHFAQQLAAIDGVEVMNEVMLNQLVVRFRDPRGGDDDAYTRRVLASVIRDGTCYPSGTTWRGRAAMRISVSNWSTDDDDVRASVEAIARIHKTGP